MTQVSDLGNVYAKKYSSTILPNKANYITGKLVDERNFSMGHTFAYLESKTLIILSFKVSFQRCVCSEQP